MKRGLYVPPRHFGSNGGFFGRKRDTEQDNDDTLLSSIAVHLITFPNVLFTTRTLPRTKLIFSVAWIDLECFSGETASVKGTRNCTNLPLMVTSNRHSYLLSMGLRELVVFCHVFSANTQSNTDSGLDLYVWLLSLSHPINHQRWQSRTILDHRTMAWLVSVSQTLSKWYKAPSSALRFACLAWWLRIFSSMFCCDKSLIASGSGQDLIKGKSNVFCF